jgi:hypothetical protein
MRNTNLIVLFSMGLSLFCCGCAKHSELTNVLTGSVSLRTDSNLYAYRSDGTKIQIILTNELENPISCYFAANRAVFHLEQKRDTAWDYVADIPSVSIVTDSIYTGIIPSNGAYRDTSAVIGWPGTFRLWVQYFLSSGHLADLYSNTFSVIK